MHQRVKKPSTAKQHISLTTTAHSQRPGSKSRNHAKKRIFSTPSRQASTQPLQAQLTPRPASRNDTLTFPEPPFPPIPQLTPYQESISNILVPPTLKPFFQQKPHSASLASIVPTRDSSPGIVYHLPSSDTQLDTVPLPFMEAEFSGDRTYVELCLLGTSSAISTKTRGLSAITFRHNGDTWLFDCGPTARQKISTRARGSTSAPTDTISRIFISHLHADHSLGLPEIIVQNVIKSKQNPYLMHRSAIFCPHRDVFAPPDLQSKSSLTNSLDLWNDQNDNDNINNSAQTNDSTKSTSKTTPSSSTIMHSTSTPGSNHNQNKSSSQPAGIQLFGPLGLSSYLSSALKFTRPTTLHHIHFIELIEAFSPPQSLPIGALFFNNLPEHNRCHDYWVLLRSFLERTEFSFPTQLQFTHPLFQTADLHNPYSNHRSTPIDSASSHQEQPTFSSSSSSSSNQHSSKILTTSHPELTPTRVSTLLKAFGQPHHAKILVKSRFNQISEAYPNVQLDIAQIQTQHQPSKPSSLLSSIPHPDQLSPVVSPSKSNFSFLKVARQSIDLQSFLSAPFPSKSPPSSQNTEQPQPQPQPQQDDPEKQPPQIKSLPKHNLHHSTEDVLLYPLPNALIHDPALAMFPESTNFIPAHKSALPHLNSRFKHFTPSSPLSPSPFSDTAAPTSQVFNPSTLQQRPFISIFDLFISPFWRSVLGLPSLASACQQFEDHATAEHANQKINLQSSTPEDSPPTTPTESIYTSHPFFTQKYKLPTNQIVTLDPTAPLNLFLETIFLRHLELEWTRVDPLVTYAWAEHDIDLLHDGIQRDIFQGCSISKPILNGYTNLSTYLPILNSYDGDINTRSKLYLNKSKHVKNHSENASHHFVHKPASSPLSTPTRPESTPQAATGGVQQDGPLASGRSQESTLPLPPPVPIPSAHPSKVKPFNSTQITTSGVYPITTNLYDSARYSKPVHFKFRDFYVHAVLQVHSCPSWGWVIEEPHKMKMNTEACKQLTSQFGAGYYLAALNRGIPVAIPRHTADEKKKKSWGKIPNINSNQINNRSPPSPSSLPPFPFSKPILPTAPKNTSTHAIHALNPIIQSPTVHQVVSEGTKQLPIPIPIPIPTLHPPVDKRHKFDTPLEPALQRYSPSRGKHLEFPNRRDPDDPRKLLLPPGLPADFEQRWEVIDPFEKNMFTQTDGRKVVLLFDSIGGFSINRFGQGLARNADILVHESTFSQSGSDTKEAQHKRHSTASTAARFAKHINAKTLVLNHFSTKYLDDTIAGILSDRLVVRYSVDASHSIAQNPLLDAIRDEHLRTSSKLSLKQSTPMEIISALRLESTLSPDQLVRYFYDKQQVLMASFPPTWSCIKTGPNPSRHSLWRIFPQHLQRVPNESILAKAVERFQHGTSSTSQLSLDNIPHAAFRYRSSIAQSFDQYNLQQSTDVKVPITFLSQTAPHIYSIPLIDYGTASTQLKPQIQKQSGQEGKKHHHKRPQESPLQVRIPSNLTSQSSLSTLRLSDIPDHYQTRRTVRDQFLEAAQELELVKFTHIPSHFIASLNRVSTGIDDPSTDGLDELTQSDDNIASAERNSESETNEDVVPSTDEDLSSDSDSTAQDGDVKVNIPVKKQRHNLNTREDDYQDDDEDGDDGDGNGSLLDEDHFQSLYRGREGVFLPGSSLLKSLHSARSADDFGTNQGDAVSSQQSHRPSHGVQNLLVGHDGMVLRLDRRV